MLQNKGAASVLKVDLGDFRRTHPRAVREAIPQGGLEDPGHSVVQRALEH